MVNRIHFDVGGQIFKISKTALENGPPSKLTRLYKSSSGPSDNGTCIEVDRPSDLFASVFALYQTGELHFPTLLCPGAFVNELEFWEISPDVTENCCLHRLQTFLDEQETLRKFRETRELETEKSGVSEQFLKSFLGKVWNIVDYSKPSAVARVYFVVSLTMVLLSIFTLALSTDPYFRRNMTNCERLEYMESSGMEKIDVAKKWLEHYCENEAMPEHVPPHALQQHGDTDKCAAVKNSWHKTVFLIHGDPNDKPIESPEEDRDDDWFKFPIHSNETNEQNQSQSDILLGNGGEFVELPDFLIPTFTFVVLESVSVVYFTVDLLLRVISCPSRKRYFLTVINFTDALALICTYVHFILMFFYKHERYRDNWMDVLKYTQVLRSLRLFRTITNVRAGQVLGYTVRNNLKDISVVILFLTAGISIFASCLYFAEEREDIRSIPVGWYWAVVTMTTVGYGDVAPKTVFGRVLACLCTMAGIMLLALTVPIFANNFLTLYHFADSEKAVRKFQTQKSKRLKAKLSLYVENSRKNNNSVVDLKNMA